MPQAVVVQHECRSAEEHKRFWKVSENRECGRLHQNVYFSAFPAKSLVLIDRESFGDIHGFTATIPYSLIQTHQSLYESSMNLPFLLEAICVYYTQRQHQLRSTSPVNTEGWIFANPATGKPYSPGRIQENWLVPAAEKVGLGRIGWHTFRHSHSSLLHALGVDLKVQQELLRHADIRTTMNIYTHAVPAALREANSKVVRLVLPAQVA